jgi:hypothetical protein
MKLTVDQGDDSHRRRLGGRVVRCSPISPPPWWGQTLAGAPPPREIGHTSADTPSNWLRGGTAPMLCVVGTVRRTIPLGNGRGPVGGREAGGGSFSLEVARGTAALIAAASAAAAELGRRRPRLPCRRHGNGKGERKLYAYLTESSPSPLSGPSFFTISSYCHWQRKLQDVLGKLAPRPVSSPMQASCTRRR